MTPESRLIKDTFVSGFLSGSCIVMGSASMFTLDATAGDLGFGLVCMGVMIGLGTWGRAVREKHELIAHNLGKEIVS